MLRSHWLYNVLGLARSQKDRRRASRQHRSVCLTLETLEDRLVPSGGNPVPHLLVSPPTLTGGNVAVSQALTSNANAAPLAANSPTVTVTAENASTVYGLTRAHLTAKVVYASPARLAGTEANVGQVTFTIFDEVTKKNVASTTAGVNKGLAAADIVMPINPFLSADTYGINVRYTDRSPPPLVLDDGKDIPATLTINPRKTTTIFTQIPGGVATVKFNPNAQPLNLTVNVSDITKGVRPIPVNEGRVFFYIFDSNNKDILQQGGISTIKNGTVQTTLTMPPKQAPGKYTVEAIYIDSKGNFTLSKATFTLKILALAAPKANNAVANFNPNAQTLTLSAAVPDISDPSVPVDEGTVTFVVAGIGTVQGAVSNGTASANIVIPAGEATGTYAINVSYSDSSGVFIDGGDTNATLTINPPSPPPCPATCVSVATAQNNMMLAFSQLISTIESDIIQFYVSLLQAQEQAAHLATQPAVSPLAFGATGGGESIAVPLP
ncbi:MAG: hypothetical protein ACYC3I_25720 [Gemmataceae bacterium]